MRFDNGRESDNVEDRRDEGSRFAIGGRGIGIGTVVLALVAMYFGVDPSIILNQGQTVAPQVQSRPAQRPPAEDEMARFVALVLGDTEDTWRQIFAGDGKRYEDPKLVLYSGAIGSACGLGQEAMGPFYCPADRKVYIDLAFYQELKTRFHAPGDFAQAYVIAHEVGHHVQNLLGISGKVHSLQQRVGKTKANELSVRLELQADCLAGVWANHADRARHVLEQGDIEEGLNAASAIGDDRLQSQAQGHVTPDSFTHGSSQQRVKWFRRGIENGDMTQCDTFKAAAL
jgi:predicted metalloprotease